MKPHQSKRAPLFDPDSLSVHLESLLVEDLKHGSLDTQVTFFDAEAQRCAFRKKFVSTTREGSASARRSATFEKFITTQEHLADFNAFAYPNPNGRPRGTHESFTHDALIRARSLAHQILEGFDTDHWFALCKHGPNSSIGVPFRDSGNSAKWRIPLSCTEECNGVFELYLKWDHSLVEMIQRVNPSLPGVNAWQITLRVPGSRLTTVPKDDLVDRTIAIEPTVNMFFQQGLGAYLYERLALLPGLDIEGFQQHKHRMLARLSSITQRDATIDWSSASDCVSRSLVKFLLPPDWFNVCERVSSKTVDVEGKAINLECFSTMGNAITFGLETLAFYCLACAAFPPTQKFSRFVDDEVTRRVHVFGDDCIVPVEVCQDFIRLATTVGFMVNSKKTFFSGKFRESCGGDFFAGRNVRPVYLRAPRSRKPSVLRAWLYTAWNQVSDKLISSLGPDLYCYASSLQYLASVIDSANQELFLVKQDDPDDSGLKTRGDWPRLQFLFRKPVCPLGLNDNNTVTYKKLVSVPPPDGTHFDEYAYWEALKFPLLNARVLQDHRFAFPEFYPSVDDLHRLAFLLKWQESRAKPKSWEAQKRDCGYVVTSALDISGELV